jgi:iron complex transport system ATP-binding protein
MTIIELDNVSFNWGVGRFCLEKINLTVKRGDFLGIIGPNGSGKTTLLKLMSKLLVCGQGEIIFQGKNIKTISFKQFARTAAVVAQFNQTLDMTVEEFVMLGRIVYFGAWQFVETGNDYSAVERALALVGLTARKNSNINSLSGGERQLAIIARALAQEPKIIFMDEPTAYLDITHQIRIMDLIARLNRQTGLTVVMVLHDLNLAGQYCEKILMVNNGRVHCLGAVQEVLTYQNIEEVYKTIVVVKNDPIAGKPYIFLTPKI